ncbi:unnamed protein product [Pylaiella littoralis]
MSGEGAFFPDAGGSSGKATDPSVAAAAGYADAAGSPRPPPGAYGMPEPAGSYNLGGSGGGGGGEQFSGGGDGGDLFGGGSGVQFSGGGGGGGDPFGAGGEQFGEQFGGGGGGGGGEVDQFSGMPLQASSTLYQPKPTDPYSLEEAAAVIETAQNQFDVVVKERAEKEAAQAAEVKKRAEEELDGFYDTRTDEVARRQARSREQEEAFLKVVSASIEESASNPWARICDLIDLKKPVVSSRPSSSGGAGGGSGSGSVSRKGLSRGMDEDNVFRATEKMRSLIIQMKADTAEGNAGDDTG